MRIELSQGLILDVDDAQRVRLIHLLGGQEAGRDVTEDDGIVLADDHPMWDHASGGDRQAGVEYADGDEQLARALRRGLSQKASVFFEHLLREPGRLVSAREFMEAYPEVFASASAVAGSLTSFSKACKRARRSLPFYWWEGRAGASARYSIRPRVAQVFLRAGT